MLFPTDSSVATGRPAAAHALSAAPDQHAPPDGELLAEVQALIREREREGVAGLAERIGAAEWADLVPQLEPSEVAVLLQWLPDDEIPPLLEELPPSEAARILRTLAAP